ncbi:MAG: CRTAC1 family protein [Polyangia bacterium]
MRNVAWVFALGIGALGCGRKGDVACMPRPVVAVPSPAFTNVSMPSGITANNFVVSPPKAIPINDHSRLAFADLDGDGWDDIVMHSLYPDPQAGIPFSHLVFMNNHDGTFRDASVASGLADVQAGFFLFGDVDNDGDEDCFAGLDIPLDNLGNAIYLNDGAGHFALKKDDSFAFTLSNTYTGNAVFADFNRDGKLDLYLGNGQTGDAVADAYYIGNGDGSFVDASVLLVSPNPKRPSNGTVVCDYDNDGDLDIFVSTYGVSIDNGHNVLWENDGTGSFNNVAEARGFAALATGNYWLASTGMGLLPEPGADASTYIGSNGFGIDCTDVNGDGLPDIYLATISHPDGAGAGAGEPYDRTWSDPSQLLINQGAAGMFGFSNEFLARKLPFNEGDIDAATVDFDNDGLVDLSVTRDNKYEGGYTTDEQKGWLGLFHQLADGSFESIATSAGINDPADTAKLPAVKAGQNLAWSDIDHDGDFDLLVGGRDHGGGRANYLFRNEVGSQNGWIALRLRGDGINVNRDAIGARVTLTSGTTTIMREVKSSRGTYNSADMRTVLLGTGSLCDYTIEIRWPDGKLDTFPSKKLTEQAYQTIDYTAGIVKE